MILAVGLFRLGVVGFVIVGVLGALRLFLASRR
jgi:hypothetical protein